MKTVIFFTLAVLYFFSPVCFASIKTDVSTIECTDAEPSLGLELFLSARNVQNEYENAIEVKYGSKKSPYYNSDAFFVANNPQRENGEISLTDTAPGSYDDRQPVWLILSPSPTPHLYTGLLSAPVDMGNGDVSHVYSHQMSCVVN